MRTKHARYFTYRYNICYEIIYTIAKDLMKCSCYLILCLLFRSFSLQLLQLNEQQFREMKVFKNILERRYNNFLDLLFIQLHPHNNTFAVSLSLFPFIVNVLFFPLCDDCCHRYYLLHSFHVLYME